MQSKQKEELITRLVESVEFLDRRIRIDRLDEWQEMDLTIPQVKTLLLLQGSGPQRMGGIAASLGIAVSAATTVVDRLVERELVARLSDPKDRRVVLCDLTEHGWKVADNFWRVGPERLQPALEHLTADQLVRLVPDLETLCDAQRLAEEAVAAT